ncbi:DNA replication complex GINS protein PSF1 [Trichinella pseudospiralis]|uniref:DNA replication complex GINS protein PSF1 n=3 Tax=Trichinella pseudospiralis TaxID=6337 RepID=A0A0V1IC03_TRIPS|nr:DNA replication complex GINS protein PSF1 [Trichinella pseudospiralis]KRY85948.1 DNA replication complex GINS protein PSF1 [Trichinella pseudospiralis]KRZ20380.1 DNA replication complex GINS protein PSF1 [Trichinella pseudospiralis]
MVLTYCLEFITMSDNWAVDMINDLWKSKDKIPQYRYDGMRMVFEEMKTLYQSNQVDVKAAIEGDTELHTVIQARHLSIQRNKRCLTAYLYNRLVRLKHLRWKAGSVLSAEVRANLSDQEIEWFQNYNQILAKYMINVDSDGMLDLTLNTEPPKHIYARVRCVKHYGIFETEDGRQFNLCEDSEHYMLRYDCQQLINQGVLKYVPND